MAKIKRKRPVVFKQGDCLEYLADNIASGTVRLVWTDPPFNTGDVQKHSSGARYKDRHQNYLNMMEHVLYRIHRILTHDGSMIMLLDYREVHNVKTLCDKVFGAENFRGEIIWLSELGNVSKKQWSVKHCTLLHYSKSDDFVFRYKFVPEIKRKAPKSGYTKPKKIHSVWAMTMSNTAPERVAYPNQKPLSLVLPFIRVHTYKGDLVVDPFCGSGTVGLACAKTGRRHIGIDLNPEALKVSEKRYKDWRKTQ